jgi:hypothetical protein
MGMVSYQRKTCYRKVFSEYEISEKKMSKEILSEEVI